MTSFSQSDALYRYHGNQIKIKHIFEMPRPKLHDYI